MFRPITIIQPKGMLLMTKYNTNAKGMLFVPNFLNIKHIVLEISSKELEFRFSDRFLKIFIPTYRIIQSVSTFMKIERIILELSSEELQSRTNSGDRESRGVASRRKTCLKPKKKLASRKALFLRGESTRTS